MSSEEKFVKRINFNEDLNSLLKLVCEDFNLGTYVSYKIIMVGYEDLNMIMRTRIGTYLVKALADFRDETNKLRVGEIIAKISESPNIAQPKIYKSTQGFLHAITVNHSGVQLFVMEYIDGDSFYDLATRPTIHEIEFLSRQAALINKINLKPTYIYDDWAVTNFLKEYQRVKSNLNKSDIRLIEPLVLKINNINVNSLPRCFIHGDIVDTNVLKDQAGDLWIIDFVGANFTLRIQELAVLCGSLLFDPDHPNLYKNNYQVALNEYQRVTQLSKFEIKVLPTFIQIANAMYIIGATRSMIEGNDSIENQYWLSIGRKRLGFFSNDSFY